MCRHVFDVLFKVAKGGRQKKSSGMQLKVCVLWAFYISNITF